jgi:hypothetical protein
VQLLSVRQPWAWAIARGRMPIENRDWAPSYRGQLAIYASMRVDLHAGENPLVSFSGWDPSDPAAAMGGIVAVAMLADVCSAAITGQPCGCGEWARPAMYHWRLTGVHALDRPVVRIGRAGPMRDAIPLRGLGRPFASGEEPQADQRGLWEPEPTVVAEVAAAAGLA